MSSTRGTGGGGRHRKPMTRVEAKAEAQSAHDAETKARQAAAKRRKDARDKAAKLVKNKKAQVLLKGTVGTAQFAWMLTRSTAKGVAWGVVTGHDAWQRRQPLKRETLKYDQLPADGEAPAEPLNSPGKGMFLKTVLRSGFSCCGYRFKTATEMNDHFLTAHGKEAPAEPVAKEAAMPMIRRSPSTGKVKILPVATGGGGRHRAPKRKKQAVSAAGPERIDALVAKFRAQLDGIGVRAMATNEAARNIERAFESFGTQTPRYLSDMRDQLLGLERALNSASEHIAAYQRMLKSDRGGKLPISPEIVDPSFRKMRENLEAAAINATAFIANFEDLLSPQIKAAQAGLSGGGADFLSR